MFLVHNLKTAYAGSMMHHSCKEYYVLRVERLVNCIFYFVKYFYKKVCEVTVEQFADVLGYVVTV